MEKAKKSKSGCNAPEVVETIKKKKRRRRKTGAAIAKLSAASTETGPQQVASSPNLVVNSTRAITQRNTKKKRRLRALRIRELPSDEASSEKEKQSLLAWVEMCMQPCTDNLMQDSHGGIEIEQFAKGKTADRSSNGLSHSLTVSAENEASGICSGDVLVAAHKNGACDLLPNGHACKVDHEGHVFLPSSNGHNCQSNHHVERCSSKVCNVQAVPEPLTPSKHVNGSSQQRSVPIGQSSSIPDGETPGGSRISTHARHGSSLDASRSGKIECYIVAGDVNVCERSFPNGRARFAEGNSSCQALGLEISSNGSLPKENTSVSLSNPNNPHNNKRKREDDKVLKYVLKRSVVLNASPSRPLANKSNTRKTAVIAWGRNIPVILTSEACTIQEWISSQSGNLFGLDVEWRPNRSKGQRNKVALLQLCNESECLIIQMLFLDRKPQALCSFLSDPSKTLAGVGVLADGKRLLHDYGLECQGGIELTALAVERLKRNELRSVGLKVLVQEVLGLKLDKPKKVTLSNWARPKLDRVQIKYACMDAWASFALSRKLLEDL